MSQSIRILFVDHIFHRKTRSSDFFLGKLAEKYSVDVHFYDPSAANPPQMIALEAAMKDADMVVFWQLDFLSPLAIAHGLPTICIPMYDGSHSMPEAHWSFLKSAKFINFSYALHSRIQRAGAESIYLKYFPSFEGGASLRNGVRAFFWRRRPDHGIDIKLIDRVFGDSLSSLHIHEAPDISAEGLKKSDLANLNYPVTLSKWLKDKSEFDRLLKDKNFYIAPRVAEGIGMGFLEAMAKGMVVAAYDGPTHNEYIVDNVSGILFSPSSESVGDDLRYELPKLGAMSKRAIELGHGNFLDSLESVVGKVGSWTTHRPTDIAKETAHAAVEAFIEGPKSYSKFLDQAASPKDPRKAAQPGRDLAYFEFGKSEVNGLNYAEWSPSQGSYRWLNGTKAGLSLDIGEDTFIDFCVVDFSGVEGSIVRLVLGDHVLFEHKANGRIQRAYQEISGCKVSALADEVIEIQVSASSADTTFEPFRCVLFKSIAFFTSRTPTQVTADGKECESNVTPRWDITRLTEHEHHTEYRFVLSQLGGRFDGQEIEVSFVLTDNVIQLVLRRHGIGLLRGLSPEFLKKDDYGEFVILRFNRASYEPEVSLSLIALDYTSLLWALSSFEGKLGETGIEPLKIAIKSDAASGKITKREEGASTQKLDVKSDTGDSVDISL